MNCPRSLPVLFLTLLTASLLATAPALAICIVPNAGGTADLPPTGAGCEYVAPPGQTMQILPPALPVGTTIEIEPTLDDPFNILEVPGGSLGGHVQTYDALLTLDMTGTGALAGFNRTLFMPVDVTTESSPRNPGDPVQLMITAMPNLDGQIFGDPDFDFLQIRGGVNQGLPPATGVTRLTRQGPPGSVFQVDSFFDITYEIDFQGAPGSILEGFGGATVGPIRLQIGNIPEPAGAALALLATGGLLFFRRRR